MDAGQTFEADELPAAAVAPEIDVDRLRPRRVRTADTADFRPDIGVADVGRPEGAATRGSAADVSAMAVACPVVLSKRDHATL